MLKHVCCQPARRPHLLDALHAGMPAPVSTWQTQGRCILLSQQGQAHLSIVDLGIIAPGVLSCVHIGRPQYAGRHCQARRYCVRLQARAAAGAFLSAVMQAKVRTECDRDTKHQEGGGAGSHRPGLHQPSRLGGHSGLHMLLTSMPSVKWWEPIEEQLTVSPAGTEALTGPSGTAACWQSAASSVCIDGWQKEVSTGSGPAADN